MLLAGIPAIFAIFVIIFGLKEAKRKKGTFHQIPFQGFLA